MFREIKFFIDHDTSHKGSVKWSFDFPFDIGQHNLLNKQSKDRWFEMPWRPLFCCFGFNSPTTITITITITTTTSTTTTTTTITTITVTITITITTSTITFISRILLYVVRPQLLCSHMKTPPCYLVEASHNILRIINALQKWCVLIMGVE